ncbi:phospholipid-transporting ATPase IK [Suricata suricatta]|uniref:phospholipid-transporting ATPase IK n=1 Tax=Suricata suricatta TaxID=37032 RepID=UPI001155F60B|nr:phospholipid-transporting ATPase IK [Suricata suricatta]
MGDTPGRGGAQKRHLRKRGRSEKYELSPERPASMSSLTFQEDLEETGSVFAWEVKANSRDYNSQFKEKAFLWWRRRKYKSNAIHTAKYNAFSFLPLSLYEQLHRASNLYFLLIIVLQGFPEVSTLPWFTLFVPLVCLFVTRATRGLLDDIGRHRSDRTINNRPCQILVGKSFLWKKWENLCVGDVVCLHRDSIVPADLLLLASTEPSSLCYVETADIDGETNLKFRQAPPVTHHKLTSVRKMASFQGCDTKIMKNCGSTRLKRTKIDHLLNRLVALIFLSLVLISMALSLGFWFKVKEFKAKHHYVSPRHVQSVATETFLTFWGFFILLSVMVPMAMFIMVEFIHLGNSFFISWDAHMYHEPRDAPAQARSTSLNDHLGQVQYVFSDKTGTLTRNVMAFKKCCIGGSVYGPEEEEDAPCKESPYLWNKFADGKLLFHNAGLLRAVRADRDEAVREFWRLLALCHTVMVQEQDEQPPPRGPRLGSPLPGEGLEECQGGRVAHPCGLQSFAQETLRTLCLAYKRVDEDAYEEWRQRHQEASLLLQNRAQALHQVYEEMEQNLQLLGATAIEDRLQDGVCDTIKCLKQGDIKVWVLTGDKQETAVNIGFACQLLSENMLILEEKEIRRILGTSWESNNRPRTGKGLLQSRLPPQVKVAMVINGEFLDQLLVSLRKEPRALVQNVDVDLDVEEPWQEPGKQTTDFLRAQRMSLMWRTLGIQPSGTRPVPRVKDSKTRESPEVRRERAFVQLASQCQAVICCRVTPKQKALVVALVKKYQRVVTLAIGDGANDVNMIKSAWRAAAHLESSLGGPASLGGSPQVRQVLFLALWSLKADHAPSPRQPLLEGWFLALFNLLYSTLPVLYIGLFEQDVSAERSLELPQLYVAGQRDELFNYRVLLQAFAHGVATSLVNFFVTLWVSRDSAGPVSFSDYQSFSVVVALSGLLSITMEVILIIRYWTVLSVLAILLSCCSYVVITWTCQSVGLFQISPETFPFLYADRNVLSHPSILLVLLLNVSLTTLPPLALRVLYQALKKPGPKEVEEPPSEMVTVETAPHLLRGSRQRRSSYAFSHREGYAELITQGTSLRRARGADSDRLVDQIIPSDQGLSPGTKESPRHPRKMPFLGEKGPQPRGKVVSGEEQPAPPGRSSLAVGAPPAVLTSSASAWSGPSGPSWESARAPGGEDVPGGDPAAVLEGRAV